MAYIKTDTPGLIRDTNSKAILFVDDDARREFREKSEEKQKIQREINNLKDSVEQIKTSVQSEISEIKTLLLQCISEKGNLNG